MKRFMSGRKAVLGLIFSMSALLAAARPAMDSVPQSLSSKKLFSGVALVASGGTVDWQYPLGLAERARRTPVMEDTRFRICSITKTFTAVLILQLMEEGRLKLSDPAGKYLPIYASGGREGITIEHLLTYSSGLANCERKDGNVIYTKPMPVDSFIRRYCIGPVEAAPGKRFQYNNGDYIVLGRIIERITGQSFEARLRKKILEPLGMMNTGVLHVRDRGIKGLATPYVYDDSLHTFNKDPKYIIDLFFAAGSMYSTAKDLYTFDQAIFSHQLLRNETVDLMLTPRKELDNVGIGFWISGGYAAINTPFAYRPGGIYGSTANWIHVLKDNTAIILLSNNNATDLFGLSQDLYGDLVKGKKD